MLKKIAVAIAVFGAFSAANAYNVETNIGFSQLDGGDLKGNNFSVGGKYYFNDVEDYGPYAESAFLGRNSNLGLEYKSQEITKDLIEGDAKNVRLNGEFYIPYSKFFFGAGLNYNPDAETFGYDLEVGILPVDGWLIALGTSQIDVESSDYKNDITLRTKVVAPVGYTHYINFEAKGVYNEEDQSIYKNSTDKKEERIDYSVNADFYFDQSLSLGVGYSDTNSKFAETNAEYEVRLQKFFTPNIATAISYKSVEKSDERYNTVGVNMKFRF